MMIEDDLTATYRMVVTPNRYQAGCSSGSHSDIRMY